jgi:multidrug efflux system outer membrane protein
MRLPFLPCLLAAGVVSACTVVGPNFDRPTIALAERFAFSPHDALHQASQDAWWLGLHDPLLTAFVHQGLEQNLNVQAAVARILQAQAIVQTTGGSTLLSGDLQAQVQAVRTGIVDWNVVETGTFQAAFVIDLFGREKRRRESAEANLRAAEFDAAAARLAMQQSVVTQYLELRYYEHALKVQKRSVSNRARVVSVLRERSRLGEATQFDLKRAEAEVAAAQADRPGLKRSWPRCRPPPMASRGQRKT